MSSRVKDRGKNLTYLRSINKGSIIKYILINGSASQQMLSEKINLTKMGIKYITDDLIKKNIIEPLYVPVHKIDHVKVLTCNKTNA